MRFALISIFAFAFLCSCGPNQRIINSAAENRASQRVTDADVPANSAPPTLEQDLEAMRTADFKYILVFRRKDGEPLDAADKELISKNTGPNANRRRLSDEGRAVIIGSNFPFETKLMNALIEEFKMEDHSKPDSGPLTFDPTPSPANDRPAGAR